MEELVDFRDKLISAQHDFDEKLREILALAISKKDPSLLLQLTGFLAGINHPLVDLTSAYAKQYTR